MIIGVTGGMGCGKSTAARMIEAAGYRRIDSDALVRERILMDNEVVALAETRWGQEILDGQGAINRKALAARIFSDDQERETLESWVHPRLYVLWRELLQEDESGKWVIEVPLLFEQKLENWFDFILCVASSADVQLARLSERGISHALAGQRISKQMSLGRKLELADMVLWNDGSLSFLQKQIDQTLTKMAS
ncbi:MAG: dephospho-CoA kinase [Opitutaceae bacterium]|jgi:dephospho-CoA kinase|nr:dephospho-CoA kinase [Opitutaceae bacterium]